MKRKHDRSPASVESGVAAALRTAGSDPQAVVFAVAGVLADDLNESAATGAALLSAISALADGSARAAAGVRGGQGTERVAQGFLLGVMLSSERKEPRVMAVAGHAALTFVKHVFGAGGDPEAAARGLVAGAVEWAAESGMDMDEAAAAAGQGAVDAAADIDAATGRRVRDAVTSGPIMGVRATLKDAAPSA